MPTIPSPRDGPPSTARSSSAKAFTRSPGRTYSMSRLDQLAQPRKRAAEQQLGTLAEQRQQSQPLQSASSMSRSMSHLAAPGMAKSLKRSDNSRSMGTLPGAVPMPRPTRAERLRRKAREYQQAQQQQGKCVTVHSTQRISPPKSCFLYIVRTTLCDQLAIIVVILALKESRDFLYFFFIVDNYRWSNSCVANRIVFSLHRVSLSRNSVNIPFCAL